MLSINVSENIEINYKTYISIIRKIWTVIPALSIMAKISEDYIFAFLFGEKIDSKLLQGSIFSLYLHLVTGFHFLFLFTFIYRVPFSVYNYINLQGSIFCLYLHSFTGFHFLFIFIFSYRVPFSVYIYL